MATFNELVSRWLSNMTSGGAALVKDQGSAPTSYGSIKATATAPAAGAAVQAFATGSVGLVGKNLSTTAAEYILLGIGESEAEAEANRDAGQFILKAGETDKWRRASAATHYAWKSASGTPVLWLGEV